MGLEHGTRSYQVPFYLELPRGDRRRKEDRRCG